MDFDTFKRDRKTFLAAARALEIVSEAGAAFLRNFVPVIPTCPGAPSWLRQHLSP